MCLRTRSPLVAASQRSSAVKVSVVTGTMSSTSLGIGSKPETLLSLENSGPFISHEYELWGYS